MKMKMFVAIVFLSTMSQVSSAQSSEADLQARFLGRVGTASEDRRVDEHNLGSFMGPGPKTGCHGDTVSAGVTINKVDVKLTGNSATINAAYNGKYTRQGWISPCVQSPPPNGHEDRNVSGVVTFTLTQVPFHAPSIVMNGVSNVGEVSDPNHDSNVFAIRAAQSAIASGL
jgi:hypothetical protein